MSDGAARPARPAKLTAEQVAERYFKRGADMANDVIALVREVNSPDHILIRTGVPAIDRDVTIGSGSLTVVAARPSHGKSMVMKLLARSALRDIMTRPERSDGSRDVVVYVTTEEPAEKLYVEISGKLPYSYRSIHRGEVGASESDIVTILQGTKVLGNLVVIERPTGLINGKMAPEVSIDIVVSVMERLESEYNLRPRALIVDYMQMMSASHREGARESLTDIVTRTTHGLAHLARSMRIPVMVAVQAARTVDGKAIKTPGMGDMQHASAIEQAAHTILGLWRPVIDNETTVAVNGGEVAVTSDTMIIRVAKSRADGAGGKTYALNFNPVTLDAYIIDPSLETTAGRVLSAIGEGWWTK